MREICFSEVGLLSGGKSNLNFSKDKVFFLTLVFPLFVLRFIRGKKISKKLILTRVRTLWAWEQKKKGEEDQEFSKKAQIVRGLCRALSISRYVRSFCVGLVNAHTKMLNSSCFLLIQ